MIASEDIKSQTKSYKEVERTSKKKILIISYFFPPCNFVGGYRIAAWAEYLHQFGYYPVIVTRQWNEGQAELTDKVQNNMFQHDVEEHYEVYRIPHQRGIRDKLHHYHNSKLLSLLRRAFSFSELVLGNFFISMTPYNEIYKFVTTYLESNTDVSFVITSGRPFQLFSIGSKISKKFKVKWIPDYRDEWNTFQQKEEKNILEKVLAWLEAKSERKWTSQSIAFLSVSDDWVRSISKFIHKPGYTVMNGFERQQTSAKETVIDFNTLTISYMGTLYPSQEIERFISVIQKVKQQYPEFMLKTYFVGINMLPDQKRRVEDLVRGDTAFTIVDRVSREEVQHYYSISDFLLVTRYKGIQGWYPVKIFEYATNERPILLFPSDDGVLEEFVTKTQTGFAFGTEEECYHFLCNYIEQKKKHMPISIHPNQTELAYYTRENQTRILSEVLDKLND